MYHTCLNIYYMYIYVASQMWCLARLLPLLIGDLVPPDDTKWINFLMLLTCLDYSFAPVMTDSKCDFLAMLIEDFLSDFTELYERRLTPKMHYMIHIPSWIKRFKQWWIYGQ